MWKLNMWFVLVQSSSRVVAERKVFTKNSSSAYMRLNHPAETFGRSGSSLGKVRKGYVPVLVGRDGEMMEKLWLPTKLIAHPRVVALLNSSADEFGYSQQGLLKIAYDVVRFKRMIETISNQN